MVDGKMTRDEALRLIDAYVDMELDVKETIEVQSWIGRDEVCRAEFERICALKKALAEKMAGPRPPRCSRSGSGSWPAASG